MIALPVKILKAKKMKILLLFLTCANQKEADTIATALLQKHLVACVKIMKLESINP